MQQKISIITINKNNAVGLEKTIRSVIEQTYSNIEYVIIDGGSDDSSTNILKQYSSFISYWISEPDMGIYNAMNKGIMKTTGEYIIFMNSGDCFYSTNTLQYIFEREQSVDFLLGSTISTGKRLNIQSTPPNKITAYYLFQEAICHQGTFTKRSLFSEIGLYDEGMKIMSDWAFITYAILLKNKNIKTIKDIVAIVETGGISSLDNSAIIMSLEKQRFINKYFPLFIEDYKTLHKIKRFYPSNIKKHLIWRFRKFLIG